MGCQVERAGLVRLDLRCANLCGIEGLVHFGAQQRDPIAGIGPEHRRRRGPGSRSGLGGTVLAAAGKLVVVCRVPADLRHVGVAGHVGDGVEPGIGIAAFSPAAFAEMQQQRFCIAGDVAVLLPIEFGIEDRAH